MHREAKKKKKELDNKKSAAINSGRTYERKFPNNVNNCKYKLAFYLCKCQSQCFYK